MAEKPTTAAGYRVEYLTAVRGTCLYVATRLGDLMDDLVVIGGLVPALLVDQTALPAGAQVHAGAVDLDLGLRMTVLDSGRYRTLTETLRRAGFRPDLNEHGRPTRQRWRLERGGDVSIDFLIQPSRAGDEGGRLRDIEPDFAAVIAPGLHLAFQDRERVRFSGATPVGERAERDVWVCGPGAFVVLKALASARRGDNKDAYDLYHLVRNYGSGVADVARRLQPLLGDVSSNEALGILRRDFLDHEGVGPRRVAEFLTGRPDDETQSDVVGFMQALLRACRTAPDQT
jgi:hypothetical protein